MATSKFAACEAIEMLLTTLETGLETQLPEAGLPSGQSRSPQRRPRPGPASED